MLRHRMHGTKWGTMHTVAIRCVPGRSRVPVRTSSAVLFALLVACAMTIAPAAARAEPHGYRMECLDYVGSGILSPITDVAQCTGGLISFYDTYDNHLVGQLDAFTMHQQTGPHTQGKGKFTLGSRCDGP